jgi:dTDP-4-amino-4,6-dideoxygalactose transaminase
MTSKIDLSDLAVFGGPRLFDEPLHVGRPNVGDRERFLARINDMFDRRWLTNHGPYVQEFEQRVADYAGVRHCIATPNATVALEIVIRALGLQGEVIVPSLTFIATAHALEWLGITPVFCDVDPASFTLDPRRVEALIGTRTTGILGVHLWGRPCNVDKLADIAARYNLRLLFDAAHAFGCSHRGRSVGGFGDAEVFSFHATKFCNSFEGGAITTNDDDLARDLRLMHNFGFAGHDSVISLGINGKMNEASAAMGLTSLENLETFIAVNKSNYEQYCRSLDGLNGVRVLPYDPCERQNFQYIVLAIDPHVCGITRDELAELCWAENALVRRYFFPGCHRMEPYRSRGFAGDGPLPVTEWATAHLLTLPNGTAVDEHVIAQLCGLLRFAVERGPRISAELRRNGAAHRELVAQAAR